MVSPIGIALESEGGHVFPFCVHFERLSLPNIALGPLERYAREVREHFVSLDLREVFLNKFVHF